MIPPTIIAFFPALGYSCLDAIAAYMVNVVGMSVFQMMVIRNTLASSMLLSYLIYKRTPHAPVGPPGSRMLLWTRGVVMTCNLALGYTALRYLSLSECWMVNSCIPFSTAILCWYFLSERFTRIQAICCLLSIVGVLLITNPLGPATAASGSGNIDDHIPTEPIYKLLGLGIAIPSTLFVSAEVLIMRMMGDHVGHIQVLATLAITPAVVTAGILVTGQIPLVWPHTVLAWFMLVGSIPCGWLAQYTMTYAAQRLSGMTMIMTTYTGLVHSTIIQWLIYGNHPNIVTSAGMVLIVVNGIVAAVYGQADPISKLRGPEHEVLWDEELEDSRESTAGSSVPLLRREGEESARERVEE